MLLLLLLLLETGCRRRRVECALRCSSSRYQRVPRRAADAGADADAGDAATSAEAAAVQIGTKCVCKQRQREMHNTHTDREVGSNNSTKPHESLSLRKLLSLFHSVTPSLRRRRRCARVAVAAKNISCVFSFAPCSHFVSLVLVVVVDFDFFLPLAQFLHCDLFIYAHTKKKLSTSVCVCECV